MSWAPHPNLLPDLPDSVHGIKGTDPWMVQCDGCADKFTSDHGLLFAARGALFLAHSRGDTRRMCSDCWAGVGVTTDHGGTSFARDYVPYREEL